MVSRLAAIAVVVALAAPALAQSWTYGTHPKWGISAHVTDGKESVALRCPRAGEDGLMMMYSAGLVPKKPRKPTIYYAFTGRHPTSGGKIVARRGDHFESVIGICGVDFLRAFQSDGELIFSEPYDDAPIARFPLTGAGEAIRKVIDVCPKIAGDLRNCGL
jgi:hypothetical protein